MNWSLFAARVCQSAPPNATPEAFTRFQGFSGTRMAQSRSAKGQEETQKMRISKLAIMISTAAGCLMALPALAVQDQPVTIGGVESVCTGVGSAKDNPAWSNYPVKLTFSNLAGENEAAEHIAIMQGGKTVMETDCDAPWLLIKAPAGRYDVHASLPGATTRTASASFSTGGSGAQKTINLAFPGGKRGDNSMLAH
jgi:hypothetical protein